MLKRVSIQNFKSLKDVTLDLQKVNLLIGPNNSGKSNFLKALEFCNNINAPSDILNRNLLYNKYPLNELSIYMTLDYDLPFVDTKYVHYLIKSEGFYDKHFERKNYIRLWEEDSDEYVLNLSDFGVENHQKSEFGKTLSNIRYAIGNLFVYKPDPSKIMLPGPVGLGEDFVNSSASNLVGFLDLVLGKYRKSTFQKIETDLKACLPEFGEINLEDYQVPENTDKQLQGKSFKRLGLSVIKRDITYWADELSEGTLYFLAILCIINQPNPPKLLLLEEPEKGIHPRRIWEIMKFIFQLAEEKDIQIILTTHNEHVVNAFSSISEAVFVFDKDEEGATHVRNLKRDIIDVSNKKSEENGFDPIDFTSDLGKSWLYGLIGGVPEENI